MSEKFSKELIDAFDRAAAIAQSIKRKIIWFVFFGLLASSCLAWSAYDPTSVVWWNITKSVLVFLPSLVWLVLVQVLSQIQKIPEFIRSLSYHKDNAMSVVQGVVASEKNFKLRNLFTLIRSVQSQAGFEEVMDATTGITLLLNPLFLLICFITGVLIFILILVAIMILLF